MLNYNDYIMSDVLSRISLSVVRDSELLYLLIVSVLIVLVISGISNFLPERLPSPDEASPFPHLPFLKRSARKLSFRKEETAFLLAVTLIYALISFHLLGSSTMPVTTWQPSHADQYFTLRLTANTAFERIILFYGEGDNNSRPYGYQLGVHDLEVQGSDDGITWTTLCTFRKGSIYRYLSEWGYWNFRFVRFHSVSDEDTISEIAIVHEGRILPVEIFADEMQDSAYPASLVIDEQEKVTVDPIYYDESYFDEIYHPRNAWEIANGQYMYSTVHPLLGTELIALSIRLLGNHPFAWRFPGALTGVLILPLFCLILKRLFEDDHMAMFGTVLASCEFMHITTSRIATLEPFSVLLMYERMIAYCRTSWCDTPYRTVVKRMFLSGLVMSLAISVKWTACYSAVGLALLYFSVLIQRFLEYRRCRTLSKEEKSLFTPEEKAAYRSCMKFPDYTMKTLLWAVLFFIGLPLVIYALVYLPARFAREGWSLEAVVDQTAYIFNYHKNLEATHPYQSTWYEWLFDLRPIWYFGRTDQSGVYHTITCFTNPMITIAGIPSLCFTAIDLVYRKKFSAFVIISGFLCAFGPWILVERCVFAYHFYPSSFFMMLAIVYTAEALREYDPNYAILIPVFSFLVLAVFVLYLPVLSGFGTSKDYVEFLEILESWQLG